ncbi:hypothetical protein EDD86DRAFT_249384 [Gorgonomyces haynaldii]|nr:hypothetical protein EDD86DRAFT_249384 [Gorgonomyces haynaldii]
MSQSEIPDRYFTPEEVEFHNAPEDCWLSWCGLVYDLLSALLSQTNPLTECEAPFTPFGRFLHVPPALPRNDWAQDVAQTPWWLTKDYCIGHLTVCTEDKLSAIQERYSQLNAHAKGYMWKRLGKLLDMSLTLHENGILDESVSFQEVGIDEEDWLPAIHFDDLTVA